MFVSLSAHDIFSSVLFLLHYPMQNKSKPTSCIFNACELLENTFKSMTCILLITLWIAGIATIWRTPIHWHRCCLLSFTRMLFLPNAPNQTSGKDGQKRSSSLTELICEANNRYRRPDFSCCYNWVSVFKNSVNVFWGHWRCAKGIPPCTTHITEALFGQV